MRSIDIVAICGLVGLAVWNFRFGKKHILYPPFIFCFVWAVAYIAYAFFPLDINELTPPTISLFLFGALCFSAGGVCVACIFSPRRRNHIAQTSGIARPGRAVFFYKVLLAFSITLLPLFFSEIAQMDGVGGSDDFFK